MSNIKWRWIWLGFLAASGANTSWDDRNWVALVVCAVFWVHCLGHALGPFND